MNIEVGRIACTRLVRIRKNTKYRKQVLYTPQLAGLGRHITITRGIEKVITPFTLRGEEYRLLLEIDHRKGDIRTKVEKRIKEVFVESSLNLVYSLIVTYGRDSRSQDLD